MRLRATAAEPLISFGRQAAQQSSVIGLERSLLPSHTARHRIPIQYPSHPAAFRPPGRRSVRGRREPWGPAWTGEHRTASRLGPGALAPDTSGGTAEAYVNPGHRTVVVEPTRGPRADGAAPLVGLGSLTRAHGRIIPSVKRRGGGLPPPRREVGSWDGAGWRDWDLPRTRCRRRYRMMWV